MHRFGIVIVVVCLLVGLGSILGCTGSKDSPAPEVEEERFLFPAEMSASLPQPQQKVLVIGLDGLEWSLIRPWIEQGRMPNFAHLMESGTWGVMESMIPTLSPLIWTTMASGVGPDVHGVLNFVEQDPESGGYLPITGRGRKVPAIWNIASAFDRHVDVIGWWATWPAEKINGVMVSDRLYVSLTMGLDEEMLRKDPAAMVSPTEVKQSFVQHRQRALEKASWETLRQFMPVSKDRFEQGVTGGQGWHDPVEGFRRTLASTETYFSAALELATKKPDLLMVYIQGTDEINHVLAPYQDPPRIDVDADEAALYFEAVPRYFDWVDEWLGRLVQACPLDEYAVLVVADHGTKWGENRPKKISASDGLTAAFWHNLDAPFVIAGKGVAQRGEVEERYSVYDVAPTIFALMNLPAGSSWPCRVLPGVEKPELQEVDYLPLLPAEAYRSRAETGQPVDAEYIEKLRALGYLAPEEASGSTGTRLEPVQEEENVSPAALNNLGAIKISKKEYVEAEEILRRAIRLEPNYAAPHNNLVKLYMATERWDEAEAEIWQAVAKGGSVADSRVDRLAVQFEDLGFFDRANAMLDRARTAFPDSERVWIRSTMLKIRLQDCAEAARIGRVATQRFTASPKAFAAYGMAAGCNGDVGTAISSLERSLELDPNQEAVRRTLERVRAMTR